MNDMDSLPPVRWTRPPHGHGACDFLEQNLYTVTRSAATKGNRGSNRISANDFTVSIRLGAHNND